jgi:hypothetical protein
MLKERQVTDRFQIAAEHAASSVATSVWLNMAATERSTVSYADWMKRLWIWLSLPAHNPRRIEMRLLIEGARQYSFSATSFANFS